MDKEIFLDILAKWNLSHRTLAKMIVYNDGALRNWMRGKRPIPEEVAAWLRRFDSFMDRNPVEKSK